MKAFPEPKLHRFFRSYLWPLFCAHSFVMFLGICLQQLPPSETLKLYGQKDALILEGYDGMGFKKIKIFKSTQKLKDYMKEAELDWIPTSLAHKQVHPYVSWKSSTDARYYRVFRSPSSSKEKNESMSPLAFLTPDKESAQLFSHQVRYGNFAPGSWGFYIPLRKFSNRM